MSLSSKVADPVHFYKRPVAILADKELSPEECIAALKNWRNDIDLRLLATAENMGDCNEDTALIDEINELLAYLEE